MAIPLLYHNESNKGCVRQANEDAFGAFTAGERRLFVVADGMGGEKGGQVASTTAVAAVRQVFEAHPDAPPPTLLRTCVAQANEACLVVQREDPELSQMGTTLELLLVEGDRAWWGHVGDSRIYRVSGGQARQETRDHTRIQQMLQDGLISAEDAADHPQRNVLSRVVGREKECVPDITEQPILLKEGDAFLMCSDGLTDLVTDEEIGATVSRTGPDRGCKELIRLALSRGAPDNVTVQIVYKGKPLSAWQRWRTQPPSPAPGPGRRRRTSRVPYIAAGVVMATAALLAAFGLGRLSNQAGEPRPGSGATPRRDALAPTSRPVAPESHRAPSPTPTPSPISQGALASAPPVRSGATNEDGKPKGTPTAPTATLALPRAAASVATPSPAVAATESCVIDGFKPQEFVIGSSHKERCLKHMVTAWQLTPSARLTLRCLASREHGGGAVARKRCDNAQAALKTFSSKVEVAQEYPHEPGDKVEVILIPR